MDSDIILLYHQHPTRQYHPLIKQKLKLCFTKHSFCIKGSFCDTYTI